MFATTSWGNFSAISARATVYLAPSHAPIWSGFLDTNGCAQVSLTNGASYTLDQSTDPIGSGISFSVLTPAGTTTFSSTLVTTAFTVPSAGTSNIALNPTVNTDAIQAAAVAGAILYDHYVGLISGFGGMGLVAGTYTIFTNTGCPGVTPPTDSCYDSEFSVVDLGTTVINGFADSHW